MFTKLSALNLNKNTLKLYSFTEKNFTDTMICKNLSFCAII